MSALGAEFTGNALVATLGAVPNGGHFGLLAAAFTAELTGEDGLPVPVSFEDITRAFELGFDDISQICRVIKAQGSIESVLK